MVLPAKADLNGLLLDKNSPGPGAVSGSQLFNAIYCIAVSESVYPFCHVMPPKKGLLFIFSAPALPGSFLYAANDRSINLIKVIFSMVILKRMYGTLFQRPSSIELPFSA
jgi:hypothetical protein